MFSRRKVWSIRSHSIKNLACCYLWKHAYLLCIRVQFPHDLFKNLWKMHIFKNKWNQAQALNSKINRKVKQKWRCYNWFTYSNGAFTDATALKLTFIQQITNWCVPHPDQWCHSHYFNQLSLAMHLMWHHCLQYVCDHFLICFQTALACFVAQSNLPLSSKAILQISQGI